MSGTAVELPLAPVAERAFESVGAADREEAEATAAGWLGDMVDGSWQYRWSRRGPGAVVTEPHAGLPCVVLSGARELRGWWVPTLFLMAGRPETACYWQWATCGERQAPKVGAGAIEGVEWVIGMLMCVVESSIRTRPE
ncbi:MAG: hypothetical protein OXC00_03705 [Acidimicrobiaceae bacterium]|nr:hypothetical protein [Acidimicrobiaceae bacterium]